jgi:hypothetical protein
LADWDGSFNLANPKNECYDVANIGWKGLQDIGTFIIADNHNKCDFQAERKLKLAVSVT